MDRKAIEQYRLALFGRMVMGVSHEVDNHLSVVLGFAELLQASGGGGEEGARRGGKDPVGGGKDRIDHPAVFLLRAAPRTGRRAVFFLLRSLGSRPVLAVRSGARQRDLRLARKRRGVPDAGGPQGFRAGAARGSPQRGGGDGGKGRNACVGNLSLGGNLAYHRRRRGARHLPRDHAPDIRGGVPHKGGAFPLGEGAPRPPPYRLRDGGRPFRGESFFGWLSCHLARAGLLTAPALARFRKATLFPVARRP